MRRRERVKKSGTKEEKNYKTEKNVEIKRKK